MMLVFLLSLFSTANAGELRCLAQLEDASSYQLSAEMTEGKVDGDALFFYLTNDGMEIGSMLRTYEAKIVPEKTIYFLGSNGKTKVLATAAFDPKKRNYRGKFEISFAYNPNPALEPSITCAITP
jgi:hypothetical protein